LRVLGGVGAVAAVVVATSTVLVTDGDGDDRAQASPAPIVTSPPPQISSTPVASSRTPPAVPAADPAVELKRALDQRLGDLSDDVSAFAVDLASGKSVAYGQEEGMATASMAKLDILLTLLMQKQDAGEMPSASERNTASAMIRQSDNDAATALWNAVGQGTGIKAANEHLGLTATVPGQSSYWGSTETNARDQVRLMASLYDVKGPLTPAYRNFALDLLTHVEVDQRWGVTAADDSGTAALKNGWLPRERDGNRWIVNSVGHVTTGGREVVLAVLTRDSATMPAGIDLIEDVAVRLRDTLAVQTRTG
jgi:hypothetical protein